MSAKAVGSCTELVPISGSLHAVPAPLWPIVNGIIVLFTGPKIEPEFVQNFNPLLGTKEAKHKQKKKTKNILPCLPCQG